MAYMTRPWAQCLNILFSGRAEVEYADNIHHLRELQIDVVIELHRREVRSDAFSHTSSPRVNIGSLSCSLDSIYRAVRCVRIVLFANGYRCSKKSP